MNKVNFKCDIVNSCPANDLGIEIWLDDQKFFDEKISKNCVPVSYEFDDDDSDRVLKIVLKNKKLNHTIIDDNGQIISDALIEIKNIVFDEIELDYLFYKNTTYTHNYNNTSDTVQENFYGTMGCNGTVELKFSTPFYMWLLEHM